MRKKLLNQKAFTLVELIIVIAIIAILAVSAWLMLVKWIGKSKDARVLSDLTTIDKAIQVTYADKMSYPTPSTSKNITVSWVNYSFTQGLLDDSVVAQIAELDKVPKNLSGDPYYYSLSQNGVNQKYQLAWQKEGWTWVTRWSYNYIAVASWTVWTADVAELPSLFVLNGGDLSGTTTLASGGNYTFIVDWENAININGYYYTGGISLTGDISNLHGNIHYKDWISTDALKAQLKQQVSK